MAAIGCGDGTTRYLYRIDDSRIWPRGQDAENLPGTGTIRLDGLATRLGYASQAAFSRAYREWTGHAPRTCPFEARERMAGRRPGQG